MLFFLFHSRLVTNADGNQVTTGSPVVAVDMYGSKSILYTGACLTRGVPRLGLPSNCLVEFVDVPS